MKKRYWISGLFVLVLVGFFIMNSGTDFPLVAAESGPVIYKEMSCGCCGIYGTYFDSKGNGGVEIRNTQNIDSIKNQYEIPEELWSCHTTIIGDYFVEGHIPLEAIEKLLEEKPDIKGIAMPGMPQGSPGMPGSKEPFRIYKVNHDGSYELWMEM